MRKYFVDSNVFLRFYSEDDEKQRQQVKAMLLEAQKEEFELYCGPPVFFEVAWVLATAYGLSSHEILKTLKTMLHTPGLRVLDEDTVRDAIELAKTTKQGFADSYIATTAQKLKIGVATFNGKHFPKLGAQLYQFECDS
jgi:predicted nucleic-acid-binding protein